jgi:RNA polymerase sigma-70 factor (ECF subfamily)
MDDLEFVRQFIEGESQARDQFIKRYSRLIYNYIQHVLGVKGFKDPSSYADDIFQGFIAFLIDEDCKRLRAFKAKNGATLATWIRYLAINFTRDYLRKVKPVFSLDTETEGGISLKDMLVDDSFSVIEELSKEEESKALDDCVDLLNSEDKYFLELNFNQKVSLEIMRDFLKLTRGAIDMQKARLMKRLKDCFKSKGFELDF